MRWSLIIGLAAVMARGAMVEPMSIEQMTASATAVARVQVGEAKTSRGGPLIFTDYTLRLVEAIAGNAAGIAQVSLPGGVHEGVAQEFAGVPRLRTGAEYVLFLWRGPSGRVQVVGMAQGVFAVEGDADARVRTTGGEIGALDDLRKRVQAARAKHSGETP